MSEATHAPLGGLFRMAVVSGTPALVLAHLRRGADVNARDAGGATPLMLALARGRADICQLLLDEGADPRLVDAAGRSVLFYAQPGAEEWISGLIAIVPEEPPALVEEPQGIELEEPVAALSSDEGSAALTGAETLSQDDIDDDGGWEPEVVTAAPADDLSLRQTTAALQVQIARHRAIDSDPDWADIEIDLPTPTPRRIRNPVRMRELQRMRSVFRRALAQGSYAPEDIEAALVDDPVENEGALRRSRAAFDTLAALGTVREDWDDWRPAGAPGHTLVSADALDDACEYFELHWSREDIVDAALRRLAKFPPSKAEEDRQAWHRYDVALQSLCAAIADSPAACAALAAELRVYARRLVWTDRSSGEQGEDHGCRLGEVEAEEPIRAEVPAHGWSEDQLAEASAMLVQLSQTHGPQRNVQRQVFLSGLGDRRLPGSLLISIPGLEDFTTTKSPLRSFLKARDFLFNANSRLAMWLARRYGWSRLPLEDRYQEASQGLLRAIDRFDYRRGNKFSSYAVWWIRQSVTRAIYDLERVIRLPVHMQETLRRVDRQTELLTYELTREPTTAELAERLALDPERLLKLLRGRVDAVPLEDLAQNEQPDDPAQSFAGYEAEPEHALTRAQLEAVMRAILVELAPREERIVRQRFGLNLPSDMTLEEIGVTVEVTRERIRQIEAKALRRLAHPAKSRRLRPFLEAGA